MDDGGERGALVLLDETPVTDVLEPSVGDVGGDLLHGVEAEVAAVGEDRGQQRADLAGVDPLARLLEVDAEPEVVLDLDEQVGQPDRAVARVQPAVQLGEAVRLRRVGRLGRVRLQPPPIVVERDLPVVSDTFQETVERIRQASFQNERERGAQTDRDPPVGWQRRGGAEPADEFDFDAWAAEIRAAVDAAEQAAGDAEAAALGSGPPLSRSSACINAVGRVARRSSRVSSLIYGSRFIPARTKVQAWSMVRERLETAAKRARSACNSIVLELR